MDGVYHSSCPNYSSGGLAGFMFTSLIGYLLNTECQIGGNYPKDTPFPLPENMDFDFIVVGAGSAGSAVARRLSEVPDWNVLLVEAGDDPTMSSEVPAAIWGIEDRMYYKYLTEPQPGICEGFRNKSCHWLRGKALGGSSSVNAMIYIRGNKNDYNAWEKLGNVGWSYEEVLPYFIKLENMTTPELMHSKYHGTEGPLCVGGMETEEMKGVIDIILRASEEMGYPINPDLNGESQIGFSMNTGTVCNGTRSNAGKQFLGPVKDRENLKVMKNAFVTKLLIDENKQIYGVEIKKNGTVFKVKSKKEVILSAGAINSPQILMLSGIGPEKHLKDFGIQVVQNLKVGENLQDHVTFLGSVLLLTGETVLDPFLQGAFRYLSERKGSLSSTRTTSLVGFINSTDRQNDWPDLQIHNIFFPANDPTSIHIFFDSIGISQEFKDQIIEINKLGEVLMLLPTLLHPKSRGKLLLRDINPFSHPKLYSNYLSVQEDVDTMLRGIKFVEDYTKTPTMKKYDARLHHLKYESCKDYVFSSRDYWICAMRYVIGTIYHQSGSCKMGPCTDPDAVVDPRLRVHGVKGLRVVDASIIPLVISGNTNAASIMIGEKGSDMIKEDWNDCNINIKIDHCKVVRNK